MFAELTELARERSSGKRIELLRRMTDLYFSGLDSRTTAEVFLFNDIVQKIVDSVERDAKVQIAVNLATLPNFPREIVLHLADDSDIDVARPVIRGATALTDEDLVSIAMRGLQAHLCAIAMRESLSEVVTNVLVDRGDREVVHTVSANDGARFSPYGIDQLIEKAQDDVDLHAILVERPDLSQETVDKLLPLISGHLVIKLAERNFDVGELLSPQMTETIRQRVTAALRDRRANIRQTEYYMEQVREGVLTLDEAIQQLAQSKRLLDIATVMSEFVQLDRSHMFTIITGGKLQTLMITFRSLDLAWNTFNAVIALREAKFGKRFEKSKDLKRDYEAIDPALTQRVIRFLKVRQMANEVESGAA